MVVQRWGYLDILKMAIEQQCLWLTALKYMVAARGHPYQIIYVHFLIDLIYLYYMYIPSYPTLVPSVMYYCSTMTMALSASLSIVHP